MNIKNKIIYFSAFGIIMGLNIVDLFCNTNFGFFGLTGFVFGMAWK